MIYTILNVEDLSEVIERPASKKGSTQTQLKSEEIEKPASKKGSTQTQLKSSKKGSTQTQLKSSKEGATQTQLKSEEIEKPASKEGATRTQLKYIILSDCLESRWDTTRRSIDGTKVLFKCKKPLSSLQVVSGSQTWFEYLNAPSYSLTDLRNILTGSNWVPPSPYGGE
jgi:hypothetical protein